MKKVTSSGDFSGRRDRTLPCCKRGTCRPHREREIVSSSRTTPYSCERPQARSRSSEKRGRPHEEQVERFRRLQQARFMCPTHPLDQLTSGEISAVAAAIREGDYDGKPVDTSAPRFNVITLAEPAKVDLLAFFSEEEKNGTSLSRLSQVN